MNSIAEVFAANVRARRKYLHLTQEALAEKSGLSLTTIQGIERHETWFGIATIAALTKALGTSEILLFQITEKPPHDIKECAKRVFEAVVYKL